MKPKISENQTNSIKIEFDSIPDHVRTELASATLDSVLAFLKQPGGREFLDEKKAEKRAALTKGR